MIEHILILGLGSNLGNRIENLSKALSMLSDEGIEIQAVSSLFETEPWGKRDQDNFINMVLSSKTVHSPDKILGSIHAIEKKMGRIRGPLYGPRTIDIDILFYDDLILKSGKLIIPHPQIPSRNFVLKPLQELIPNYNHPEFDLSIDQLAKQCADPGKIIKLQRHETFS